MSASAREPRELGTAVLGGLVVGAVLSSLLGVADVPFYFAAGAFVGGVVAAYLLHGKLVQATLAGALAGVAGTPFLLGLSDMLVIFGLIPNSSEPAPSLAELQLIVGIIFLFNLIVGALGGLMVGAAYRGPIQSPATVDTPKSAWPGTVSGTSRFCVQCGASLSSGVVVCPHCGAKQPGN